MTPGDAPATTEGAKATPEQKGVKTSITALEWDTTMSLSEQVDYLWPPSADHAHLLYRIGPEIEPLSESYIAPTPTYLAFDVSDGAVIHVIIVPTGSSTGYNLKTAWNQAMSTRTNAPTEFDHSGGSTGGNTWGVPPSPRPVIDGYVISPEWQQQAIDAVATIYSAETTFGGYADDPETTALQAQAQ
jgi:hypothetical protein